MAKIINKKTYYKITFRLTSPLAIGSGENSSTDQDIILNSEGKPYIPASSLAGAVRDLFSLKEKTENPEGFGYIRIEGEKAEDKPEEKAEGKTEAGTAPKKDPEPNAVESRLIFYDADLQDEAYTVSVRDSVSLD